MLNLGALKFINTDLISLKWLSVQSKKKYIKVRVMVFNATFNNISVISWLSVLLMEETGISGENHRPAASQ